MCRRAAQRRWLGIASDVTEGVTVAKGLRVADLVMEATAAAKGELESSGPSRANIRALRRALVNLAEGVFEGGWNAWGLVPGVGCGG